MILEDLEYIFKEQLDDGTDNLYYMLIDGERKLIRRHTADKLEELLPLLSAFEYAGTDMIMPRFKK